MKFLHVLKNGNKTLKMIVLNTNEGAFAYKHKNTVIL